MCENLCMSRLTNINLDWFKSSKIFQYDINQSRSANGYIPLNIRVQWESHGYLLVHICTHAKTLHQNICNYYCWYMVIFPFLHFASYTLEHINMKLPYWGNLFFKDRGSILLSSFTMVSGILYFTCLKKIAFFKKLPVSNLYALSSRQLLGVCG